MPVYSSHRLDYDALRVGERINQERQGRVLTLKDLERKTGISAARLSQIENGLHELDVQQAFAIAEALGLRRQTFVPRDVPIPYQITRDQEVRAKRANPIQLRDLVDRDEHEHHSEFWPLADVFIGRHLEPMVANIHHAPIGRFYYHDDFEFCFVLDGTVEFYIRTSGRVFEETLHAGDCVYFDSSRPHFLRSRNSEPARTLHVLVGSSAEVGAWAGPLATRHVYSEATSEEGIAEQLGRRIMILREALRLTPGQVAKVIGVTEGQLRQLENGRRALPLGSLIALARAFGKPLRDFTGDSSDAELGYYVQRRNAVLQGSGRDRRGETDASDRMYQPLVQSPSDRHMFPYLLKLKNRPNQFTRPREHHGQEFIYVLDGEVEMTITLEGQTVTERLTPGDSCYLDCSVPHALRGNKRNPFSETSAEVIDVFWCALGEDYLFVEREGTQRDGEQQRAL